MANGEVIEDSGGCCNSTNGLGNGLTVYHVGGVVGGEKLAMMNMFH